MSLRKQRSMLSSILRALPSIRHRAVISSFLLIPNRSKSYGLKEHLHDLWARRQLVGPEDPLPRCQDRAWNYQSELYAFIHRLGETHLNLEDVHAIFASKYLRETDGFDNPVAGSANLNEQNASIVTEQSFTKQYAAAYLRYHCPKAPEECITAVVDSLLTTDNTAYVARNLGFVDLLETQTFPCTDTGLAKCLLDFVELLHVSSTSDSHHADYFIQDFILTQLIGQDIFDIWYLANPMGVLIDYLQARGQPGPESRLLRESGRGTAIPVFCVGIYVNKSLIGEAPGETVPIAEDMAARNSLRHLFKIPVDIDWAFGQMGREINLEHKMIKPNWSLSAITDQGQHLSDSLSLPEPLNPQEILLKYKEQVEKPLGNVYRRRLKHRFYWGTRNRLTIQKQLQPKISTV